MFTAVRQRALHFKRPQAALVSPASAVRARKQQWSVHTTATVVNQHRHDDFKTDGGSNPHSASPMPSAVSAHRGIHSSQRQTNTLAELPLILAPSVMEPARPPLSVLPLAMVIRSLATTTVSSSPLLLNPSMKIMTALAQTKNPILAPDTNPVLRYALKKTFYAQFCAGETGTEVRKTIAGLKSIGFTGVILGYAKEVVLSEQQRHALAEGKIGEETDECIREEIEPWAKGTMETVRLAQPGDFVALKFTGAGALALYQLSKRLPPSNFLAQSVNGICHLAAQRGVRLLFDAEQDALQDGIDDWTLEYARRYNQTPNSTVVFGTYQAYKKSCPQVLVQHLADARERGYSLGVKLVRGAYINSDPRRRFHDTIEETHACYDGIAASVLMRQWNPTVRGEGVYPPVSLVLATHNAESVRRARVICDAGAAKSPIAFAQLQGMADEVSCELVEADSQLKKSLLAAVAPTGRPAPGLPAYKYLVWGTTGECMKYLLRRAHENKDAVGRTRSGRDAMWAELRRRCKAFLGIP